MSLTNTAENLALNFLSGEAAVTAPTAPLKIRLMTAQAADPDATAGTELATSGGYTAGGVDAAFGAASGGALTNGVAVSWTNMPATTIVGVELWDSAATPVRIAWADITDVTLASGDTLEFAAGAIDFTLD